MHAYRAQFFIISLRSLSFCSTSQCSLFTAQIVLCMQAVIYETKNKKTTEYCHRDRCFILSIAIAAWYTQSAMLTSEWTTMATATCVAARRRPFSPYSFVGLAFLFHRCARAGLFTSSTSPICRAAFFIRFFCSFFHHQRAHSVRHGVRFGLGRRRRRRRRRYAI